MWTIAAAIASFLLGCTVGKYGLLYHLWKAQNAGRLLIIPVDKLRKQAMEALKGQTQGGSGTPPKTSLLN